MFSRWIIAHYRALQFSFVELIRTPIVNFITVCVIAIAIALPLGFFVVVKNLQQMNTMSDASKPTISLFLKMNMTNVQVNMLTQQLEKNPVIEKINYVSPTQGLAQFEKNTPFTHVVNLLQQNPIPGMITVIPKSSAQNPAAMQKLYKSLQQWPQVDMAQLDMHWVTRLSDIILIGKVVMKALSILLGAGVILIIGHTLRTSLASHAKEIQVMRLVGASRGFIRRPLLYRGILYGLLGGAVACLMVVVFLSELQLPVTRLIETYHTEFHLNTISWIFGANVLLVCAILGFISAWLISTQFLNQPECVD